MKVEVAVLGSPVPNKPYGFCGRKATLKELTRCRGMTVCFQKQNKQTNKQTTTTTTKIPSQQIIALTPPNHSKHLVKM